MDIASSAGHVQVLEWFRNSGLDVKYDKTAMHHASLHGRVDVLQWWLDSGLQLIFDADALTLASKYNRPEVLEWWDQSGLPIMYRMCDIEEALEDAMGGGDSNADGTSKLDQDKIGDMLGVFDVVHENSLAIRAEIGAKTNRLEMTERRLSSEGLNFTEVLSDNEDVNYAELIMKMKLSENVYNASLSMGTRIIQPTLLDFLR